MMRFLDRILNKLNLQRIPKGESVTVRYLVSYDFHWQAGPYLNSPPSLGYAINTIEVQDGGIRDITNVLAMLEKINCINDQRGFSGAKVVRISLLQELQRFTTK
jgi:hypothetical protein